MIYEMLKNAKKTVSVAANLSDSEKNAALSAMASALLEGTEDILRANKEDLDAASDISEVMKDRLRLTKERIASMANAIRELSALYDPNGRILERRTHKNGLEISKVSVPFGVVAVIFESRPNVAADTAALALKSGNVSVLRCGKESYNSCNAIVTCLKRGLRACCLDENLINLVEDRTRESAKILMTANEYIDLLIPRGGAGLIRACVETATVPCIETGTGICHVYVDEFADIEKALNIIENAKTSRPSVCNAEEVCLVNEKIARTFLPRLKKRLVDERIAKGEIPVELRLCEKSIEIIEGVKASDEDFSTEFLDYVLAVKVTPDLDSAIAHVSLHSTHHSDAIITERESNADKFTKNVDSAAVYVNASTRFTDGGELGLGAEIGISTQKLHARGPMGINELNTYKYIIRGCGQTR